MRAVPQAVSDPVRMLSGRDVEAQAFASKEIEGALDAFGGDGGFAGPGAMVIAEGAK